jgi:hypothetical protein
MKLFLYFIYRINKMLTSKSTGGGSVTYKGGNYKVQIGPRGGKYITHMGRKVYIDIPRAKIPKMSV